MTFKQNNETGLARTEIQYGMLPVSTTEKCYTYRLVLVNKDSYCASFYVEEACQLMDWIAQTAHFI